MLKKTVVVDFETYYDKTLSVSTMGVTNYVAQADAYIVSIVTDGIEFCGTIAQVREHGLDKLALDPENQFYAANSNFDQAWWEKYFPPAVHPWKCILDQAAFHQYPRDLAGVARAVLNGLKLDKGVRDEMKGVRFESLPEAEQQRVIEYCLNDSLVEKKALEAMGPMSPIEEQLAAHTRLINRRGVHVNIEKIERDIELLGQLRFNEFKKIPWTNSGTPPLSYPAFADWCYTHGKKPPASLDKRDEECNRWIESYPEGAGVLKAMRTYRGSNTKLEKLKTIAANVDEKGRIPLDLLYCGARHTRRWASKNINVQNLDSKRVFAEEMAELDYFKEHPDEEPGIFMREYFIPPPGCKFGILDYSQIEPRCLAWIVGNTEMLDAIRAGYGIYEAHAKATMGWKGQPGTLKKENPDLYKFAKIRVLALGYGMGWSKFQATAALPPPAGIGVLLTDSEAQKAVSGFRESNPLIVEQWSYFDSLVLETLRATFRNDNDRTLELEMPTGDKLKHFHVQGKGRGRGFESFTTKADFTNQSHQPSLWGGTLTENVTQRMARDILGEAILRLEKAGIPVLWHAHDEVILCLNTATAEQELEEAERIMSVPPAWCPDIPLAVEGSIHDHYTKLA